MKYTVSNGLQVKPISEIRTADKRNENLICVHLCSSVFICGKKNQKQEKGE